MGDNDTMGLSKGTAKPVEQDSSHDQIGVFTEFRRTVQREIENALIEKMRSFRDDILRTKIK